VAVLDSPKQRNSEKERGAVASGVGKKKKKKK
jgi:hypothetical protein